MATMRLVPSAYTLSSTQYLQIADAENMYTNTDSTTYAQVTHNRANTTAYYLYIHGFNFSSLPDEAENISFTVKIRGLESGLSTNSTYRVSLYNNTTSISNTTASTSFSTTAQTITIPTGSLTWSTMYGYGNNFRIRVPLRRNSSNTSGYVRIYGAEIEVTYTVPVYYNVTIQNSTSANVVASDTNPLEGTDVAISTDTLAGLTITDNGVNVTSQFVQSQGGSISAVPGSTFTTGFSQSGANFYQSSSTTSTSWLQYAIGHSAESPYSTSNTSNTYVKPEGATGWINYTFDFDSVPASATITSMSVKVYGARENASIDTSHVARFQCYSGSTAKGTLQNFTSTSNGLVTVTDPGTWTAAELHDAQLRFELGYYGGRMLGITWAVTYEANGYEYTIVNVASDHTIVVTGSGSQPTIYYKVNNAWVAATTVYKKVNGSWVQQTNLANVFDPNINYVKG